MFTDDDVQGAFDIFITEARELLQQIEDGLLELEGDPGNAETVNAIFRGAHTLKGSSGLFGLDHLVRFTHVVETVLDMVRAGQLDVTPGLVSALLPCADHLSGQVEAIAGGRLLPDPAEGEEAAGLLALLEPFLGGAHVGPEEVAAPDVAAPTEEVANWRLCLRFGPDCLRNGMDPLSFVRYLGSLGTVERVVTMTDALPEAAEMDPETCYLTFEVDLSSTVDKGEIEGVFEFVRDDSEITIVPAETDVDRFINRIRAMPQSDRLGDILLRSGAVTQQELDRALQVQRGRPGGADASLSLVGDILVDQGIVPRQVVDAALRKQRKGGETRSPDAQTIRVDAGRLDKLIDLVGELVIAQAAASASAAAAASAGFVGMSETSGEVMRLVEQVRHSALSLRMVPIGSTLRRFERVVRDIGASLGKEVNLVITGGDAEMDKALVERISDPLMHLVRNSLDHGVELPAERQRRGKPAHGTLQLNAYHDAGSIVLEVSDDGGGLDRERILAKAVERGLIEPETVLTDQEVFDLIFEPGFSTAAAVSDLSGRGVGMDVVKRNVQALRGSVEIESTFGAGTTLRIRLPLTLAIIDGFLVGVGGSSFVVPLDRVTECVELAVEASHRDCINLRGEVLPLIRLRPLFGIDDEPPRRQSVVVVEESGQRAGLVVDALLGQFQTVIKPLGPLFTGLTWISGATMLGDGGIALIVDVGPLVAGHVERTPVAAR
ncbi:chemotaxis protein CheA [Virgisporangium ochraceum]